MKTSMNPIRILLITSGALLALPSAVLFAAEHDHGGHAAQSTELTKVQTAFLGNYELVRAALAADDLESAKRSAANIAESQSAMQLSKAMSLNAARVAFKKLSLEAIAIAKGHVGYYVVTCPMAESDWLQTNTAISNPYLGAKSGAKMLKCGSIKD